MEKHFQEKLDEINRDAKRLRAELKLFAKRFPNVDADVNACIALDPKRISGFWSYRYGGSITMTMVNLPSFKDLTLINLLEYLETHCNVEFKMEDIPKTACKKFWATYQWTHGRDSCSQFDITLYAYLKADAAECQRVQIGEETQVITTPIYKIVCDDGSMT